MAKPKGLKVLWESFCRFYTQSGPHFGNATLSYAAAKGIDLSKLSREATLVDVHDGRSLFGIKRPIGPSEYDKEYNRCSVKGHQILSHQSVKERIYFLLNGTLKDQIVDARMAELIIQKEDGHLALAGIREYNRVRARTKPFELPGEDVTGIKYVVPKEAS